VATTDVLYEDKNYQINLQEFTMSAELKTGQSGTTLILTVSNPGGRVAHPDLFASAVEALEVAERDSDTGAVIFNGLEGLLSIAGNLSDLAEWRLPAPDALALRIERFASWLDALRTLTKPVIAVVDRSADGAGLAIALACDFIVADEGARFSVPQLVAGVGPDSGISWLAARGLPKALAHELVLAGATLDAARLYHAGVINRLAESGKALDAAIDLADELGTLGHGVFARSKRLLEEATTRDLHAQMQAEGDALVALAR
jgi:enoyl-CoA hydratase/carnithine racemase